MMIKSYAAVMIVMGVAALGAISVHANEEPVPPTAADSVAVSAPVPATPTIVIRDVKLVEALDADHPSALFLVLDNMAPQADALRAIETSACASVELHNHVHDNGIMKMVKVDQIDVAADGAVTLEPMGYHAMCFGGTAKAGETVSATFTFTHSAPVVVTDVTVVPLKKSVKAGSKK